MVELVLPLPLPLGRIMSGPFGEPVAAGGLDSSLRNSSLTQGIITLLSEAFSRISKVVPGKHLKSASAEKPLSFRTTYPRRVTCLYTNLEIKNFPREY